MTDLLRPQPPGSWRERLADLRDRLPVPASVLAWGGALAAVVAVGFLLLRGPAPPAELTLPRARPAGGGAGAPGATPTTEVAARMVVHVAGAVLRPGVHGLLTGARVADAVAAAGGAAPDAEIDAVNLAAKVSDGDRLYVPRKGEVPAAGAVVGGPSGAPSAVGAGQAPAGPLDLNRATAEQLEALSGIGPSTARAIIEYRDRHGRFKSVDELLAVRGIGPAKLEALRSQVKV